MICLAGICSWSLADESGPPKVAQIQVKGCVDKGGKVVEPRREDAELVERVAARILREVQDDELRPISDYVWPPTICIHPTKAVNAFASLQTKKVDGREIKQPHIQINQGYLDKIVRGDEEFFAKVFGHELSHILLRHVDPDQDTAGPLAWNAVSREHETNADVLGMKLALRANFPYRNLVSSMVREREDGNFCAFQALSSTHPAWADRLAAIDQRQSELWRATSTFENGTDFLRLEQYGLAARCFQQLIKDFPRCHEGWTNLGYAKLMLYCDTLDAEDVKDLALGQLALGAFYRRAESIEPARGVPEDEWRDAVAALREALRIKPKSIVATATLATALLVQPVDRELEKANQTFAAAVTELESRDVVEIISAETRAAILANAGAAKASIGDQAAATKLFSRAAKASGGDAGSNEALQAIRYHQAQSLAARDDDESRDAAIDQWRKYLGATSSSGVWWEIAYKDYERLCGLAGAKADSREALDLARKVKFRPVLSVAFVDGKAVTVGAPLAEAVASLGEGEKSELIRGSSVYQIKYRDRGIDLVGSDVLLAVRLRNKKAPAVKLTPLAGGVQQRTLQVGITLGELEMTVAGSGAEYDTRFGTGNSVSYRFFPQLGLGASLDEKKVVDELIVGRLPYPPN